MDSHRHLVSGTVGGDEAPRSRDFALLTYDQLAEEIRLAEGRANSAPKREAWRNLLQLVERVSAETGAAWDPAKGSPWNLVSVEIEGFQGSTLPLSVQFDTTPGITILHGPNGSGKSTIADGIRAAISGTADWWAAVTPGKARSGKSPLWEKVNCSRDSDRATATVVLRRESETLTLTSQLGKDGSVYEVQATRDDELGEPTDVDIGSTSWPYAVEGHPAVFSYADVERRVQQHEDLQRYIKNLLALGGCFDHLDGKVSELSLSATQSQKKLSAALKSARAAIETVDRRYRERDPSCTAKPIEWADNISDIARWLEENDLADGASRLPEVTEASLSDLSAALEEVDRTLEELHGNFPDIHSRLAPSLSSLHTEVQQIAEPGYVCPVCDSDVEDWVNRLGNNIADIESFRQKQDSVVQALGRLRRHMPEIRAAIEVLTECENVSDRDFIHEVEARHRELSRAFDVYGYQPVAHVVNSFLGLRNLVVKEEWRKASSAAVELSNFTRQWQRSRRAELGSYISLWTDEHENAESAPLWEATKKCVGELSDRLTKTRTSRFEGKAGLQVTKLLEDAGISLESLRLTRARAEIEVQGADGRGMELAMLSAGQRNAFLLAPLFATADAGPFGFLILDDPVHSFDEIRVDRLAAVISELGSSRRIIILTHDERLKEHLLARSPSCEAWAVSRDAVRGEISIEQTDELWRVLVRDAEAVWRWSPKPSPTGYLTECQIIRGLLRQALDNALRQCVVKYSLKVGLSVSNSVAKLDTGLTTQKRIELAREIIKMPVGVPHPIERALQACGHHVSKWNNATHGTDETKADLKLEIQAGADACAFLGECSF
ncbi:AAA family ATPase [Streptomyces xantholiticus]|uniref:Nuclease SbcCD subunit C n=1 Tax=Streptomyces xantholiticus TaxID=68285 RepID=A0ABV1UT73_9ACTN